MNEIFLFFKQQSALLLIFYFSAWVLIIWYQSHGYPTNFDAIDPPPILPQNPPPPIPLAPSLPPPPPIPQFTPSNEQLSKQIAKLAAKVASLKQSNGPQVGETSRGHSDNREKL